MMEIRQLNLSTQHLTAQISALNIGQISASPSMLAAYTRRPGEDFRLLFAQLRWSLEEQSEVQEMYREYALISKHMNKSFIELFFQEVLGDGYEMASSVPKIKVNTDVGNWSEEIVPSDISGCGFPSRRYSYRIENNSGYADMPLLGYDMPFYKSGSARLKELLGVDEYNRLGDGRYGHIIIDVPDTRGFIDLGESSLSIRQAGKQLSLTGQINSDIQIRLLANELK